MRGAVQCSAERCAAASRPQWVHRNRPAVRRGAGMRGAVQCSAERCAAASPAVAGLQVAGLAGLGASWYHHRAVVSTAATTPAGALRGQRRAVVLSQV